MFSIMEIQKKLLPDLLLVMQKRYHILKYIGLMQPVGRRSLSGSLGLTERVLRSEVSFLKEQKLLSVTSAGMSLTKDGKELVGQLENVMREITGINDLEVQLKNSLGIAKVIIVSGDSDTFPWVKSELGRACAACMKKRLKGKNIIAVNGGSTMAAVAEMLPQDLSEKDLLFVASRGGLGEDVKNQANTICATMAERTHAKHRLFFMPDQVSEAMYASMVKEPSIQEILQLITSADMVIHGIGDAVTMAERRKTSKEDLEKIVSGRAVGEAFGYYFDEAGKVVHKVRTIGLQLEELEKIEHVIAVAGGSSKAKAIRAYLKQAPVSTVLITDEGAANELVNG
ncbi:hypothetical protein J9303_00205 [Bacillaceae bacterium Marseille-Q3522]|nr:hypothetical protein [Bacillaceae bacterium Marseille-Q3522]